MTNGHRSQLFAVLVLMITFVGAFMFIGPMQSNVKILKADKQLVAADLQMLQTEFEKLSLLAEDVSSNESTKQALLDAVPVGLAQDELLLELTKMAKGVDFDLNGMSFSPSLDPALGNALHVSANVSGSSADLQDFLRRIETGKRLMRVTSMNVQKTGSAGVIFNMNIEAFYQ